MDLDKYFNQRWGEHTLLAKNAVKKNDTEELWHFKRTCEYCGYQWGGLHCPHDGYQNPCPECKKRPTVIHIDDVCDCEFDC